MRRVPPPSSLSDLEARAAALTGVSLGALAAWLEVPVPESALRGKGWVGQVVEAALGGAGGSSPTPDFGPLGVELKTIPVDDEGRPRESTFVCTAPIEGAFEADWETSRVCKKLAHVLWVPVRGDRGGPLGERTVGVPRLWVPDAAEVAALAADWRMLSELIAGGELQRINARLGRVLQLRPKGANAEDYAWMLDEEGTWVRSVPFGFYLRARFTGAVLAQTQTGTTR